MKKYKLLCLNTGLEEKITTGHTSKSNNDNEDSPKTATGTLTNIQDDSDLKESNSRRLSNVRGCMDFLCSIAGGGQSLLRRVEQLAHDFEQRQLAGKRIVKTDRYN